jgi:hypothetical protein
MTPFSCLPLIDTIGTRFSKCHPEESRACRGATGDLLGVGFVHKCVTPSFCMLVDMKL